MSNSTSPKPMCIPTRTVFGCLFTSFSSPKVVPFMLPRSSIVRSPPSTLSRAWWRNAVDGDHVLRVSRRPPDQLTRFRSRHGRLVDLDPQGFALAGLCQFRTHDRGKPAFFSSLTLREFV